jgi:hypothetical protein
MSTHVDRAPVERAWMLGGALLVALALIAGWFLVVNPELGQARAKHDAVDAQRQENWVLQQHVNSLRQQSEQLDRLTQQLDAVSAALPATAGIDTFTRQLSASAEAAHVRISSISADTPTPVDPTATATAAASAGIAQPAVASTYSIAVTVISSGTTAAQQDFLHRIQSGARAALVSSAALAPPDGSTSAQNTLATLTTQLQVFVAPHSAADLAQLQKLIAAAAPK